MDPDAMQEAAKIKAQQQTSNPSYEALNPSTLERKARYQALKTIQSDYQPVNIASACRNSPTMDEQSDYQTIESDYQSLGRANNDPEKDRYSYLLPVNTKLSSSTNHYQILEPESLEKGEQHYLTLTEDEAAI